LGKNLDTSGGVFELDYNDMARFKRFTLLILAFGLFFGTQSCEDQYSLTGPNGASGDCTSTKAQIAVYDTFLEILCGCQEPFDRIFPPNTLTCTIRPGTQVLFWYFNTNLRHQIQSTSAPTFPISPLSDPNASNPVKTHAVTFTDVGNYEFNDVYNRTLIGTIVVQ
jgi:hypothetical protein